MHADCNLESVWPGFQTKLVATFDDRDRCNPAGTSEPSPNVLVTMLQKRVQKLEAEGETKKQKIEEQTKAIGKRTEKSGRASIGTASPETAESSRSSISMTN